MKHERFEPSALLNTTSLLQYNLRLRTSNLLAILKGINIARAMKMVHGNLSSSEKKLNRPETLTSIHFQRKTSLLSTPLTSLSIKQTTQRAARNYLLV